MAITPVTPYPGTPPNSNDPATFNARADVAYAYLPVISTELVTFAGEVNATISGIESSVDDAADSATAADGFRASAQVAAVNAELSKADTEELEASTRDLFEDFATRYLGPFASDPTLDEFGDPILEGAIYYNTVSNSLKVYDGDDWLVFTNPVVSVDSVNGQTGSVVLDKDDVGLANVDNTSDANKPISTATQTALNLKANSASLGTLAGLNTVNNGNWSGTDLAVTNGGTGSSNAADARTALDVPSRSGANATGTWGVSISGNAATAAAWQTARTISLGGDLTGEVSINGSENVTLTATIENTKAFSAF